MFRLLYISGSIYESMVPMEIGCKSVLGPELQSPTPVVQFFWLRISRSHRWVQERAKATAVPWPLVSHLAVLLTLRSQS